MIIRAVNLALIPPSGLGVLSLEDEATTKAAQEAVEQKVLELASQRDIYERLTRSLGASEPLSGGIGH